MLLPCGLAQLCLDLRREAHGQGLGLGGCHLVMSAVREATCHLYFSVASPSSSSTREGGDVTRITDLAPSLRVYRGESVVA